MTVNWKKYEEVGGGNSADRMWPEKGKTLKVGDSVEGRYVEKQSNIGPNKSNIYILETSSGEKVGMWGSTVIDGRMEKIAVGKMVAIEYAGEEASPKTGRTYKAFKVGFGIETVGDEDPFRE